MIWLQMAADASQADAQTSLANHLLRKSRGDPVGKALDLLKKPPRLVAAMGWFIWRNCLQPVRTPRDVIHGGHSNCWSS